MDYFFASQFVHLSPEQSEGSILFGLEPDSLRSDVPDCDDLKRCIDIYPEMLARYHRKHTDEEIEAARFSFKNDLLGFCVYVAMQDGPLSANTADAMRRILGSEFFIDADLRSLISRINNEEWANTYPSSFEDLVSYAAKPDNDMNMAGGVFCFYYQLARYVYAADHDGDFRKCSRAFEYVDAYRKYIERVSMLNFHRPFDKRNRPIDAVCKAWKYMNEIENSVLGTWDMITSEAPSNACPKQLSIGRNGVGFVTKKWLFTNKRVASIWGFTEQFDGPANPQIGVPDLDLIVFLEPVEPERLLVSFKSPDQRINGTNASLKRSKR